LPCYYEWDYRITYTPFTYYRHLQKLRRYGIKSVVMMDASSWYGEPFEKRLEKALFNFELAVIAQTSGFDVLPNYNAFISELIFRHALPKHVPSICIDGAHSDHSSYIREDKMLLTGLLKKYGTRSAIIITGKKIMSPLLQAYIDVFKAFNGKTYFVPSEARFLAAGAKVATMRCKQMNRDNEARRFHEARRAAAK
jgi:hypothetical protein